MLADKFVSVGERYARILNAPSYEREHRAPGVLLRMCHKQCSLAILSKADMARSVARIFDVRKQVAHL